MARRLPPPRSDEQDRLDAIRRFFLQPHETYSIAELSALWRVNDDDVRAVFHDELTRGTLNDRIAWAVAVGASVSFALIRPLDIERALGRDFSRVRPETWRTVAVVVHLPTFVTEALVSEPSLPSDLPLDVRIEQLLVELFTRHPRRTVNSGDDVEQLDARIDQLLVELFTRHPSRTVDSGDDVEQRRQPK